MLLRKLRLQRSWSQETLAEVSGLSVRTIQRIERGAEPSLETRLALASVFGIEANLFSKETEMTNTDTLSDAERDAMEYVRDLKGFYSHLALYVLGICLFFAIWLFQSTSYPWFVWPMLGWGIGVAAHGMAVFEWVNLFSAQWEKRQIERRMSRK